MSIEINKNLRFQKLSDNVIVILGLNPGELTLDGSNTYLIGSGNPRILIDSGDGVEGYLGNLKECLSAEGNIEISHLLITHHHHDHVGGIPQVKSLFPSVKVYKYLTDTGRNSEFLRIHDGQEFKVRGASVKAIHTPGHTDDHTSFLLQEDKSLFTGDCILGTGSSVFTDLGSLMQSFKKMKLNSPQKLYCGHGPVILNGMEKITEYERHRELRNTQIIKVLQNGEVLQAEQIVDRIYPNLPEKLKTLALGSVKLHLKHLVESGFLQENMYLYWKKQ